MSKIDLDLKKLAKRNAVDSDHKWGYQIRMVNNELYCGKLLILENRERGGWHYHKKKTETFIVLAGEVYLDVSVEDEHGWSTVFNGILTVGKQITIAPMERHFMQKWPETVFDKPAVILEVSTHDDDEDTYYVEERDD